MYVQDAEALASLLFSAASFILKRSLSLLRLSPPVSGDPNCAPLSDFPLLGCRKTDSLGPPPLKRGTSGNFPLIFTIFCTF